MRTLGVIPARYESTRFPGKPLVDIKGKSMIQRVYEQAVASNLDEVLVATDDSRIFEHCQELGMKVVMTDSNHQSGTDRCAEVAETYSADLIVNVQGDEPFIDPVQINDLIRLFEEEASCDIGTLVKRLESSHSDITDPNKVKVVLAKNRAMYFSRSPIPYQRNKDVETPYYKHVGLYAYKTDVLKEIAQLQAGILEQTESLEQLRWLENNFVIMVKETNLETPNVDTPDDLKKLLETL